MTVQPLLPSEVWTGAFYTDIRTQGPALPGGLASLLIAGIVVSCVVGWFVTQLAHHGDRPAQIVLDQILFAMLGIIGLMLAVPAAGFTIGTVSGFTDVGDSDAVFDTAILTYTLAISAVLATMLGLWKRSRRQPKRAH